MGELVGHGLKALGGREVAPDQNARRRELGLAVALVVKVGPGGLESEPLGEGPKTLQTALGIFPLKARDELDRPRPAGLRDVEHAGGAKAQDFHLLTFKLGPGPARGEDGSQDGYGSLSPPDPVAQTAPGPEPGHPGRIRTLEPDQDHVAKAVGVKASQPVEVRAPALGAGQLQNPRPQALEQIPRVGS